MVIGKQGMDDKYILFLIFKTAIRFPTTKSVRPYSAAMGGCEAACAAPISNSDRPSRVMVGTMARGENRRRNTPTTPAEEGEGEVDALISFP